MCTLIDYTGLKDRKEPFYTYPKVNKEPNKTFYQQLFNDFNIFSPTLNETQTFLRLLKVNLENYDYLDSILISYEGYNYFKTANYDFLLRSDMDVFLTPLFAKWLPRHCNDFYVGRGAYSHTFNQKRLGRVARELGLKNANEMNLGSTWISTPHQFRLVSYFTLLGMAYLSQEEFSQAEKQGKIGTLMWPEWHFGVCLLYGQHLALNHLIGENAINLEPLRNLIDFSTANEDSIYSKLHLHVYHNSAMFSKFEFKKGKYSNVTVSDEQAKMVKYFAVKIASESNKMKPTEMLALFFNQTLRKT